MSQLGQCVLKEHITRQDRVPRGYLGPGCLLPHLPVRTHSGFPEDYLNTTLKHILQGSALKAAPSPLTMHESLKGKSYPDHNQHSLTPFVYPTRSTEVGRGGHTHLKVGKLRLRVRGRSRSGTQAPPMTARGEGRWMWETRETVGASSVLDVEGQHLGVPGVLLQPALPISFHSQPFFTRPQLRTWTSSSVNSSSPTAIS